MAGSVMDAGSSTVAVDAASANFTAVADALPDSLTTALSGLIPPASTEAGELMPPDGAGAAPPSADDIALLPPAFNWRAALTEVILDPAADGDMIRGVVGRALTGAYLGDFENGGRQVADLLEELRGRFADGSNLDYGVEGAVALAVRSDTELANTFSCVQLGIVKANGATLTPYQEGVFLQKFKELVPAQTIDEARANALLAAQAAPANPPGTDPDGQVTRGNFNLDNALFVLSPAGYRSEPVYVDSQGNSFQDFIRNGGNDDNPYSMEISSYTLINGQLSEGGASTTLDDGSYATVNFDEKGFSVRLPNGQRYSDTGWYDDITDPVSAYRGVASPSDPLSIYRFKALAEGTAPPAMPSAPPATPSAPPAKTLPEPQIPPGVEPGNDKGLDSLVCYPATSQRDAVRLAVELIRLQPLGQFSMILRDVLTGQYWVAGPFPAEMTDEQAMIPYAHRFELMSTPESGRYELPKPMPAPNGRPGGSLNAVFYEAMNYRDASRMVRMLIENRPSVTDAYCVILQNRTTGQYYVDGPFRASEFQIGELRRLYGPDLNIISVSQSGYDLN